MGMRDDVKKEKSTRTDRDFLGLTPFGKALDQHSLHHSNTAVESHLKILDCHNNIEALVFHGCSASRDQCSPH